MILVILNDCKIANSRQGRGATKIFIPTDKMRTFEFPSVHCLHTLTLYLHHDDGIPTNTTTIRRRNRVTLGVMLVALFCYRNRLDQATSSLLSFTTSTDTHTKQQLPLTEPEELQSMMLADDLLLSAHVPCGKEKCFFQSKTSPNKGYLIARSSRSNETSEKYQRLVEGWELATRLQQEYHIQHFLESPPQIVPVSDHLAALINQNLWYETQDLPVDQVGNMKNQETDFHPFPRPMFKRSKWHLPQTYYWRVRIPIDLISNVIYNNFY